LFSSSLEFVLDKTRVTLHDVAAQAGVSHQTVSRVINNSDRVRPETRLKVEDVIEELGYSPNAIARSMVRGNTHTLGCISPNLTDTVFNKIIESAQAEARRQGFFVLIGTAPSEDEVKSLLDELLNRRVDGLMILNPRSDNRYKLLQPLMEIGIPIIYLKNTPGDEQVSSVICDDKKGGYIATKYLLDLGHTKIAIILGPENEECTSDRLEGYQKALGEQGITLDEDLIVKGNWSPQSGRDAAAKLIGSKKEFSAIFSQNDRMAAGAIRNLVEAGYRVPEDFSVIGYDNISLATLIDPPLTTIQQPLIEFGEQAAKIIIDLIKDGNNNTIQVSLNPKLIERKSCTAFEK